MLAKQYKAPESHGVQEDRHIRFGMRRVAARTSSRDRVDANEARGIPGHDASSARYWRIHTAANAPVGGASNRRRLLHSDMVALLS
jgi:hypothetical protein